jgi:hypothetical protein
VDGGARTAQHFHSLQSVKWNGDVEIVVSRLRVVHSQAIDQNQRLTESGTAQGKIALHAIAAALAQIN